MKKVDKLILKGFFGPYIISFFIVEFVLVMQFMWKWIDDLLGRGYAMIDYVELISLFGVTIIPMALPLTVLLSSVMVYGDMAEHFELSSLKSAGTSLVRLFQPAMTVAFATALLSITASNYFKPIASKAFLQKFNSMRLSKVTFALEEKVFNIDFNNHAIYVDEKDADGKNLSDVLIYYTHQNNKGLLDVISAQRATMQMTSDGKYMVMDLFDGKKYQESANPKGNKNYLTKPDRMLPINTISFSRYRKVFELSDIFKDMSNLSLERKKFDLLNTFEILNHVDSLSKQIENKVISNKYSFNNLVKINKENIEIGGLRETRIKNPTTKKITDNSQTSKINTSSRLMKINKSKISIRANIKKNKAALALIDSCDINMDTITSVVSLFSNDAKEKILVGAKSKNSTLMTRTWNIYVQSKNIEATRQKFLMRLNQQYCWSLICILLLFIGGPMGAIVRKGGFGYPMLVAIGFYMSFVILIILGERLLYSNAISGVLAGWLPFLVLFPFAFIVTFFALKDIKINLGFLKDLIPGKRESIS